MGTSAQLLPEQTWPCPVIVEVEPVFLATKLSATQQTPVLITLPSTFYKPSSTMHLAVTFWPTLIPLRRSEVCQVPSSGMIEIAGEFLVGAVGCSYWDGIDVDRGKKPVNNSCRLQKIHTRTYSYLLPHVVTIAVSFLYLSLSLLFL